MADPDKPWETVERDEDIGGWKVMLSGHRGGFYVTDDHLEMLGMKIDAYVRWLRQQFPHGQTRLDS